MSDDIIKEYERLGFIIKKNEIGNYNVYFEGNLIGNNLTIDEIKDSYKRAINNN